MELIMSTDYTTFTQQQLIDRIHELEEPLLPTKHTYHILRDTFKIFYSEALLLHTFLRYPDEYCSKAMINEIKYPNPADRDRGCDRFGRDRSNLTIEVTVCRLRRQLKPHGIRIITANNIGYMMAKADVEKTLALLPPDTAEFYKGK